MYETLNTWSWPSGLDLLKVGGIDDSNQDDG